MTPSAPSNCVANSDWLVVPRPNPAAKLRLICLPYAGGTAAIYTDWYRDLPDAVEFVAVQLPGRANRMFEQAHTAMRSLVAALYLPFRPLTDKPYVLLGHSMGSRIAFELARECRRRGDPLPTYLIASGSKAPHLPRTPIHELPDVQFIEKLREFNGTPEGVLQNQELMQLYLPMLRADFKLSETYAPDSEPALDCPLAIFSGEADPGVSLRDLVAWRDHFTGGGEVTLFAEDHFFIEKARAAVVARVNDLLRALLRSLPA